MLQASTRLYHDGCIGPGHGNALTEEDMLASHTARERALARLLTKLVVGDDLDDCWTWTGATSGKKKYGRMKIGGRLYLPHRLMAFLAGTVATPSGPARDVCVLHRCDVPQCCNPRHLWAGSLSDNMLDCAAKGRLRQQQG